MSAKAVDDSACDRARTGNNINVDVDRQLHFYETSSCYDCTFSASVSQKGSYAKIFKCHRIVLANASTAFETMLCGRFKEANQGRDDEIKMEVSPTVFDLAMRFIYANKCDFQSCELAVEIYYFANMWMIEALVHAAGEFLIKGLGPDDVLLVYEMCIDLNISTTSELRKCCRKIVQEKTFQVLSSNQWLDASREAVLKIYRLHHLSVGEAYLLKMLVVWGKARCSSDQSTDLRAQIDSMLGKIRFGSMSFQEFSAISKECDVLTTKEKMKIMESLFLSDANLLPPEFSLIGYPRNLINSQMVDWRYVGRSYFIGQGENENEASRFSFYVDQGGIFLEGIHLQSVDDANANGTVISITCSVLRSDSGLKLGTAESSGVGREVDNRRCIAFDEPVALARGFLYDIEIKYNSGQPRPITLAFMNGDTKFRACPGFCTIFFHPATKVRDVYAFKLRKC